MTTTLSLDAAILPKTMRAWTYTQPGLPATALTFTHEHPTPSSLPANSVLVKISHCGFNGGVILIMELFSSWMHATPAIPELDFSGSIIATNAERADLQAGTLVFGTCPPILHFRHGSGTLAEYVVVPAKTVMPVPTNMSMEHASALSGCGCTAVQLVQRAKVKKGDRVLINGGSGGLGSILVQVVRAAVGESGQVVATCSGPKSGFVKSLGADEVIDYTKYDSLAAHLAKKHSSEPFNVIFDAVGDQSLYIASPSYLSPRGIFFNAGAMAVLPTWRSFIGFFVTTALNFIYPSFLPNGVPRRFGFLSGNSNQQVLAEVKELVEDGKLTVPIDSVWSMEDALKGYAVIGSKRARGKVVIRVQDL